MLAADDVRTAVAAPGRLAAVTDLESTLAELRQDFAPLARLAASVAGVGAGYVTLVAPGRLVVVASTDAATEGDHALTDELSTCAHVVAEAAPVLVADCREDERFAANPFVVAGVLRFYAGAPLVSPSGQVLGAVCVMGPEPHAADQVLADALADLARQGGVLLQQRRRRVEQLAQRDVLEAVASGEPLTEVLDRLARHVESLVSPGLVCSVLVLDDDGVTLRDGAGPSLPLDYRLAIDGVRAGEGVGSCGTAVHRRSGVVVADIATDPLWSDYRDLAGRFGLASCTSSPVLAGDGTVLGTFAVYRRDVGTIGAEDEAILAEFRDLTRVAIAGDRSRRALTRLATRDTVTGLLNRSAFLDAAAAVLARPPAAGCTHAVLFCDMDHFKLVNDSLGHAAGDAFLREAAQALRAAVRPTDVVARFAGDAFTIVLPDVPAATATDVAERVAASFAAPVQIPGHSIDLSVSIGLATTALSATRDLNALLRDADLAMHDAKLAGRARVRVCDGDLQASAARALELRLALRLALGTDQLRLDYQPEVDARTGRLVGFEALLRWTRPGLGPVSPADFIPVAEEAGLIVELGRQVLESACRQTAGWRGRHPAAHGLTTWVNVSAHQLADPGFVDTVTQTLRRTGLPGAALGLEITESAVMADPATARTTLSRLRASGVRVAIDDFGTGYSSLSTLKTLPVDVLKVDRSFISGLGDDVSDTRIVTAVVSMAHALGLSVVAEGVETAVQRDAIRAIGCETAQGYLFGRPVHPDVAEEALRGVPGVPGPRAGDDATTARVAPTSAVRGVLTPAGPCADESPEPGAPSGTRSRETRPWLTNRA